MSDSIEKFQSFKSMEKFREACDIMPGGVNGDVKYRSPYPLFLKSACGSRVIDVDGNEYIDYVLSYGALILGHGHKAIREAILDTLESEGTVLFGNPAPDEILLGSALLNIFMRGGMIRFTNSGMEATLLSVRLAMAYCGKRKIAKFDGHYHGANPFLLSNHKSKNATRDELGRVIKQPDSAEITGELLDDILVLPFNDIEGSKRILDANDPAAIILEPFEDGYIPADRDFMTFLRNYTKERGIILIFDEVKTGLRVRLGGATEFYKIEPDIICLGKIIGGGTPIGAVIGKREIMDLLDPRASEKKVFHSGTFNGNPLTMRLGLATINELTKEGHFENITKKSSALRGLLTEILEENRIEHTIYGEGGLVNYVVGSEPIKTQSQIQKSSASFRQHIDRSLLEYGVYVIPGSRFSLSLAHSNEDIERTGKIFTKAFKNASIEGSELLKKIG